MQASARWTALTVAGLATAALVGCSSATSSSGPGNSTAGQPSIPVATAPPTTSGGGPGGGPSSGTSVRLTGNFCHDIKNMANNMQVPANATGSLSALETNGVQYLNQVREEFNGLAGEAPKPVAQELNTIAADYQSIASAISSKNLGSLQKIEKKMAALTSKGATGTAFRALIAYMVTKCP